MANKIEVDRKFELVLPKIPTLTGVIYFKGANGTGKTTMIRILAKKFAVIPESVFEIEPDALLKNSSLFFEDTMISHNETLQKNLTLINSCIPVNKALQTELLERFKLSRSILNRPFKKCSTGEKSKFITLLNLSQANKSIFFLDEPFDNIDHESKNYLLELIGTLFNQDSSNTLYISSHQPEILKLIPHHLVDFDSGIN